MSDEPISLRLARYLGEFSNLRTTAVLDLAKYEKDGSVLWFGEMPQEADCVSPAWNDQDEERFAWLVVKQQTFPRLPPIPASIIPWVDSNVIHKASTSSPPLNNTAYLPQEKNEEE